MGNDIVEIGARSAATRERKTREFSHEEREQREEALHGFTVQYSTSDGVTTMTLSGEATLQIVEITGQDGNPAFISPFVVAPQSDLYQAIEYTGRNLVTTAIKAEFARQNPSTRAPRGKAAQEKARADALEAKLQAIMDRFGVSSLEELQTVVQKQNGKKSA